MQEKTANFRYNLRIAYVRCARENMGKIAQNHQKNIEKSTKTPKNRPESKINKRKWGNNFFMKKFLEKEKNQKTGFEKEEIKLQENKKIIISSFIS